jgi:hypothetical protein
MFELWIPQSVTEFALPWQILRLTDCAKASPACVAPEVTQASLFLGLPLHHSERKHRTCIRVARPLPCSCAAVNVATRYFTLLCLRQSMAVPLTRKAPRETRGGEQLVFGVVERYTLLRC